MVKIGPLVNHSHLIGGWSLGFRLYNTSLPTINPYMYYNKNKEYENDIKKTITMYSKAYMITYKDDSLVTKLNLKSKTILVNDFCTNDFVLYQIK
jgi:hypothetical protein